MTTTDRPRAARAARCARGVRAAVLAALLAGALATGCSTGGRSDGEATGGRGSATPSPSIRTLTPVPLPPPPPPSGRIRADMRQSSRDAAAGRMEVWVDNDTARSIRPLRIVYTDPRFRTPLAGTRLRPVPSQSERGFQLVLPRQPACDHRGGRGTVEITYATRSRGEDRAHRTPGPHRATRRVRVQTVRVTDPTDVAGRYAGSRCLEIAVARVARLRWSDRVPWDGARGSTSTLTLLLTTTGRPGPTLTIDTIGGTPVLSPAGTDVWRPGTRVRGTDAPSAVRLPVKPTRCDAHAFAESGGATAFLVGLHLGRQSGQLVLRMSIRGARHAIAYAKQSCGDLSTMS